jgi:hypothetical protein
VTNTKRTPSRVSPFAAAILARLEGRKRRPHNKAEARRRLKSAQDEIKPVEDEIKMLRTFVDEA